uniref:SWIM-type domain-containing protein n=1 Tax=Rhizophagus irregularis (strain DAOM 181602 / DAOM 197198 / MUCL 43194) TaxID=747089 RepID=U9TYY9_RHIID
MYNEDDNHSELNTQEDTNIPDDKTYLKALLATISRDSIREIWRIIPYMSSNSYQHVILLKDGTFLCTCLLLVSRGIVCQHYFKLMEEKRKNEARLASIESQTSNNMRLRDGRIYNVESIKDPIIHKGKASNEENSKVNSRKILKVNNGNEVEVTGERKCRLYQEIRHYAPKCLNKGFNKEN